jgi:hypothetical protein
MNQVAKKCACVVGLGGNSTTQLIDVGYIPARPNLQPIQGMQGLDSHNVLSIDQYVAPYR